MRFLISYTQGVIRENIEPPPEPLKLSLTEPRLENIRLNLLSGGHSHTTRRKVEENSKNKKFYSPGVEHERLSKNKYKVKMQKKEDKQIDESFSKENKWTAKCLSLASDPS